MGSPEDCTLATCPVPEGFFSSPPSLAGSAVFLVAFCFLIPINLFTGIRYKTALYSSAIIAGLAFEAMGHVGRILLRSDPASTLYFVLYTIGVNMGPTFIAAAIFQVLPHILVLYGKEFTLISQPIRFAVFFLAFSAFALAFQAVGAAFTATGGSREEVSPSISYRPPWPITHVFLDCPRDERTHHGPSDANLQHRAVLRRLLVFRFSPSPPAKYPRP